MLSIMGNEILYFKKYKRLLEGYMRTLILILSQRIINRIAHGHSTITLGEEFKLIHMACTRDLWGIEIDNRKISCRYIHKRSVDSKETDYCTFTCEYRNLGSRDTVTQQNIGLVRGKDSQRRLDCLISNSNKQTFRISLNSRQRRSGNIDLQFIDSGRIHIFRQIKIQKKRVAL